MQGRVRLRGKIVLTDGSPLPGSAGVELYCNGRLRQQAFTFSDGSFDIEADDAMAFGDARVGTITGNPNAASPLDPTGFRSFDGSMNLIGCELRALLPGYASERIQLGIRRPLQCSKVGNILVRRLDGVSGSTISFTTLAAPKKARKAYEKALEQLRKRKVEHSKASKELEKAVKLYPQYAAAWNLLGRTRLSVKDLAGAREAFQRAIEADPNYVGPYVQLALLEGDYERWEKVVRLSNRILEINPYITEAHYFNAVASFKLGKLALALKSIAQYKETKASRRLADSYYLAGAILAGRGSYTSAAAEFRQFLAISPEDPRADRIREHLSSWDSH